MDVNVANSRHFDDGKSNDHVLKSKNTDINRDNTNTTEKQIIIKKCIYFI